MVAVSRKGRKRSRFRDERKVIVLKGLFGGVGTIENSHISGPSGEKNSSYASSKKKTQQGSTSGVIIDTEQSTIADIQQ